MVNSGVVRCFELAFKVKTMNRTTYRTSGLMALPKPVKPYRLVVCVSYTTLELRLSY